LEVAFLDLSVRASFDGLDESLLSPVALINDDGGGGLDFLALLSGLLLLLLIGTLALESVLQGGVSLFVLLLAQTGAGDALNLAFSISTRSLFDGGQSQLDSGRRADGVLVVVFLFSLLVQFGSQLSVGLFELLQQLIFGLASVLLLLASLLLLVLATSLLTPLTSLLTPLTSLLTPLTSLLTTLTSLIVVVILILLLHLVVIILIVVAVFAVGIVVVHILIATLALHWIASALLLLLVIVAFVVVLALVFGIVVVLVIVGHTLSTVTLLLLMLRIAKHTVKAVSVRPLVGAGYSQAQSDHDEETHSFKLAMIKTESKSE